MTTLPEHVVDTLHESWKVFRAHHPVGAYLPVGQLDGDCHNCGGAWPCETVRFVLAPLFGVDQRFVAEQRKRLASAWSAFLALAMDASLDDGQSVMDAVLEYNPELRERLRKALS
jgi:hypothetical protein